MRRPPGGPTGHEVSGRNSREGNKPTVRLALVSIPEGISFAALRQSEPFAKVGV